MSMCLQVGYAVAGNANLMVSVRSVLYATIHGENIKFVNRVKSCVINSLLY